MNGEPPSIEGSAPARIVIAEDHPVFREALRHVVSSEADLEVVGEAVDGFDALELCRRLQPELVLMDLGMPRMDGLEATRAIKREFPRMMVLVLTASVEVGSLSEALRAGASGYILKDSSSQEIVESIRRVLRGESPVNQELTMELLLQYMDEGVKEEEGGESTIASSPRRPSEQRFKPAPSGKPPEASSKPSALEVLTEREIEVLRLLVQQRTNKEIAKTLFISVPTVNKHTQQIFAKLGVSDRTQAAQDAVKLGLDS